MPALVCPQCQVGLVAGRSGKALLCPLCQTIFPAPVDVLDPQPPLRSLVPSGPAGLPAERMRPGRTVRLAGRRPPNYGLIAACSAVGIVALVVLGTIALDEYRVWLVKREARQVVRHVESAIAGEEKTGDERATAVRRTTDELRRHGVGRLSSETRVRQQGEVWIVSGQALLETRRVLVPFECRFTVSQFGRDRLWQLEATTLDGALVYSRRPAPSKTDELRDFVRQMEAMAKALE